MSPTDHFYIKWRLCNLKGEAIVKKVLSIFVALVMVISVSSVVFAASGSGQTSGGSSGKTSITWSVTTGNEYLGSQFEAYVRLKMNASAENTLRMEYGKIECTPRSGSKTYVSAAVYANVNSFNSRRTVGAGNTYVSIWVPIMKASSSAFGAYEQKGIGAGFV